MLLKLLLFSFLFLNLVFAENLNIAVATNVSFAIKELTKEFNKTHPKIKIRIILGSSGKLNAQIKNNAPYDIFMSANMKYPDDIYKNSLALKKAQVYALGSLVLFSKQHKDFSKGLSILKEQNIRRISIANPKIAPYGFAAKESLEKINLFKKIENKLVYAESASQSLSFTLKASDIGFIAKSTLFNKHLKHFKKNKNWIEINKDFYSPIKQGIILLKKAKGKKEAYDFYNFMLSEKAQKILKEFGYITVEAKNESN